MRFNEDIAISTSKVLLVPYDEHHVLRYHEWMKDPAIQEATASEPLTLEEEYENQQSWRTSHDKLTFIVCRAIDSSSGLDISNPGSKVTDQKSNPSSNIETNERVYAGQVDAPDRMVGDINLFLTPWEGDEDDENDFNGPSLDKAVVPLSPQSKRDPTARCCNGEVDIMIADRDHRGKGLGIAAVSTLLHFVRQHLKSILAEYSKAQGDQGGIGARSPYELKDMVAKINEANAGSIALFTKLGFRKRGKVNYFGEIEMVLEDFGVAASSGARDENGGEANVLDYRELLFDRSRVPA